MLNRIEKIGFGGGCHWCTEAVFQTLKGVIKVEQGWIASSFPNESYSEAVIVYFDKATILLSDLIDVHLATHSCTSSHSMRDKYRSAIYTYNRVQSNLALNTLERFQSDFELPILTQVLDFGTFKKKQRGISGLLFRGSDAPILSEIYWTKNFFIIQEVRKIVSEPE